MVLTEDDEMVIALCLIIIAVAMQIFERPQLICFINFIHQAIIPRAFSYPHLKTCCLPIFSVRAKKGAHSMCIHLTASIGN